jgi:hypothetical protein
MPDLVVLLLLLQMPVLSSPAGQETGALVLAVKIWFSMDINP